MPAQTTTPRLSQRFDEALRYASNLHRAQTRKGGDIPYVGHLLSVASLVIDRSSLELMAGPQLSGYGLSLDEQVQLPRVAQEARPLFLQLSPQLRGDDALVREELTRAVRRAFMA